MFLQFFLWNRLKNLTNVVKGKLGKLVHKQNCSQDLFYFINYNIIILQVRSITIMVDSFVSSVQVAYTYTCVVPSKSLVQYISEW